MSAKMDFLIANMLSHSFFKLKESVLLVELLRHIGIRVVLIEKLNGMESAAVDVEVYVAAVEIRSTGFPYFYFRMRGFYRFPDGLADTFALNTDFHIEESQLAYNTVSCNNGTAHTLAFLADGFVGFGTFCL